LIAIALVVVALAVVLFGLSRQDANVPPLEPASVSSTRAVQGSSPVEGDASTTQSSLVRADASKTEEPRVAAPVGTAMLVVKGTVRDERSGSPVPSVDVDASAGPLPGDKHALDKTTTDDSGRFVLSVAIPSDLPWDRKVWAVQVSARGERFKRAFTQLRPADFEPDPAHPGTYLATHDFAIKLLFTLRGRLVRESDGTGIANGGVDLVSLANASTKPMSIAESSTDEAGRFSIQQESAVPDKIAVLGFASGFLAKMVPASWDATRAVDLGDIALAEGACLEGFVQTADGSAPAANQITASTQARGDDWVYFHAGSLALRNGVLVPQWARAPIGPDGKFRLCGLAPGEYTLSVSYLGCRTGSRMDFRDVRAPASGVRLQVAAAVYRLRALDARTGEPLERAQFIFDGPPEFGCALDPDYVVATDPGLESPGRIVAAGHRALKCTLPALAPSEVRKLEFRLEPLPPQIAPTIVVTSPKGAPVEEIEVNIRSETPEVEGQGPLPSFGNRAPDGRHVLPKLVPGDYRIDVEPRRQGNPAAEMWLRATIELRVREGMEPKRVELVEGGLVRATVRNSNGDPIDARTSLVRTEEGEPELIDWRTDTGIFGGWIPKHTAVRLAKPLPAGEWTLRFEADGFKKRDVRVRVDGGGTSVIEAVLEPVEPR
jgi:hypothetical protein